MSTAVGVPFADILNRAEGLYGVDSALLQAIRVEQGNVALFDLPPKGLEYAEFWANNRGVATAQNGNGSLEPESNIYAAAWFLAKMQELHGDAWTPVSIFLGGGPVGDMRSMRVQRRHFPPLRRAWR